MNQFDTTHTEMVLMGSAIKRIEAKLDKLLEKKKPVKSRSSKVEYSTQFQVAWDNYPKRVGNNPKQKAYTAYMKRHDEGATYDELNFAASAYCLFCDATVEDKSYIMMASTFYGCHRPYECDWAVPDKSETMPKNNDDLLAWSANKGFRNPAPGESFSEYRRAVEQLYRANK